MDFINTNLPYLLAGISVGGQYALIAIGYTMVYGILRLINFAHGDVFMVAGLLGIYISAALPMYIAIPVVIVLTIGLGFFIERAAYKPLRSAPRMSVMISASFERLRSLSPSNSINLDAKSFVCIRRSFTKLR